MSRNFLHFEAQCVTPSCPGCGIVLQQLLYTAEQVRGFLLADEPMLAFCAYGDHRWQIDQTMRRALQASG
jgi:hypothetical protein